LRSMDSRVPDYPDDVTVYLVVNDFGKFGKAFVETDIAEADREAIIRNFTDDDPDRAEQAPQGPVRDAVPAAARARACRG
jgi:hypothetical protein